MPLPHSNIRNVLSLSQVSREININAWQLFLFELWVVFKAFGSTHWWWRLRYNLYYCLAFLQLSQFIWLCIIKPSQYSKVFDEIYYNQFPVTAHSHLLRFHEIIQFRYLTISSQKVKTVCKIFLIVLYDK